MGTADAASGVGEGERAGNERAELRILLVTSDKFPPFRPAAYGIFMAGFAHRGHCVDCLMQSADASPMAGTTRYGNGTAHVAPSDAGQSRRARLRKYWLDFRNDLRVFRLLRTGRYSLVQIKDKYAGALVALAAARMQGVPAFYWLAYPHPEASVYAAKQGVARYAFFYAFRGALQRWLLYRLIMPACAHVFVQSEQMREDIAREGIPAEKMTAVPSSVQLAELDRAVGKRPDRAGDDDATIVYLGTLLRERQLDFLIRVLERVAVRVPGAKLVLVGKGETAEDEAHLWREAERLKLTESVSITGWLPRPVAWQHVRRAAVCVSPYYPTPILLSTSPTKLIEYMALGKAVVGNHHPEQTTVIRRSGCGIACEWNETAFSDALARLLADPQRAAAMGRAGRRWVEEHRTHSAMTALVERVYRDVLAASPGRDVGMSRA